MISTTTQPLALATAPSPDN